VDPWTELAKAGPMALVLGGAVIALWRENRTLREQQRQDLKESSQQLLESARLMESILRKAKGDVRSLSPFPSSSP
jgi:hypothetical protein